MCVFFFVWFPISFCVVSFNRKIKVLNDRCKRFSSIIDNSIQMPFLLKSNEKFDLRAIFFCLCSKSCCCNHHFFFLHTQNPMASGQIYVLFIFQQTYQVRSRYEQEKKMWYEQKHDDFPGVVNENDSVGSFWKKKTENRISNVHKT